MPVSTERMREYLWYVEPKDSHTNAVFAEVIGIENFNQVCCADGKSHRLWLCENYQMLQSFWASREKLQLNFNVFSAETKKGKTRGIRISNCTFLLRRNKKR